MDEGLGSFFGALQLADPGLPIGRFVHSHGLESWLADRPAAGHRGTPAGNRADTASPCAGRFSAPDSAST